MPQHVALQQGLTLVPVIAQLELTLPFSAQLKLTLSPIQPQLTRGCVPKVLKFSSDVSDEFPKVLKLSFEVSECKPLPSSAFCASTGRTSDLSPVSSSARMNPTNTWRVGSTIGSGSAHVNTIPLALLPWCWYPAPGRGGFASLGSTGAEGRKCHAKPRYSMAFDRPISVYRLSEMPIQSCRQSVSAPRGKASSRLIAHTELRTKRQRLTREAIYRNRPLQ